MRTWAARAAWTTILALCVGVHAEASPRPTTEATPHDVAERTDRDDKDKRAKADVSDLDGLLRAVAKMPGLSARFTEEKKIALLAVPLRSSGTVHFAPTRGLVRHTLEPSKQSVLVDEKEIVLWDGKTTRHVSLATSPSVEALARAFSLLLAADRAGLEQRFDLKFTPADGAWTLTLTPKLAELKSVVAGIEIEGRGLVVATLRVREANGDVGTTRFDGVDTAKRYAEDEADRVFRVPPS